MILTFEIPKEKENEFIESFLQIYPLPEDEDVSSWIRRCVKNKIFDIYGQGREQVFRKENIPVYDKDIIQVNEVSLSK